MRETDRSAAGPGAGRRHLDGARPDAAARADAEPRRPVCTRRARNLRLDRSAGHDGRLDDDDDRLRPAHGTACSTIATTTPTPAG